MFQNDFSDLFISDSFPPESLVRLIVIENQKRPTVALPRYFFPQYFIHDNFLHFFYLRVIFTTTAFLGPLTTALRWELAGEPTLPPGGQQLQPRVQQQGGDHPTEPGALPFPLLVASCRSNGGGGGGLSVFWVYDFPHSLKRFSTSTRLETVTQKNQQQKKH